MSEESDRLAAALAVALIDAHPSYANTAGWRGGIGGSAITRGCSIIDPPPDAEETEYGLTEVLRDYLIAHPDFDLTASRAALVAELRVAGEVNPE